MRVPLLLVGLLLATGCAAFGDADASAEQVEVSEVQPLLRTVAEERRAADADLEAALTVVADVEGVVTVARTPGRAEEGLERVGEVHGELEELEPRDLREELHALAATVDEARGALGAALEETEGWDARYLRAQDEVLRAVREHAAAGDALAQLIDRHRPTYAGVLTTLAEVHEDWLDEPDDDADDDDPEPEELDEAVEAALAAELEALALAREELATYAERREETASRVNMATADAATVFEQRPVP